MACLNLQLNNDQQQGGFLGPRISFSNDFGETTANMKHPNTNTTSTNTSYREAPVSSDFEFSVPCFASNSADELFFRSSKILPLKDQKVVTLRDELLAANDDDDEDDGVFLPKSSSGWWRFGRSQTQSQSQMNQSLCLAAKKGDHKINHGGLETIDEANHYHRK